MAFKRPLPEWNNPGIEPPQSKKDMGWLGREKPPAQWHNWFQHLTYKALEELQQGAAHVTFGATAPASPDVNDLWVDTSGYPVLVLKAWDGTQWVTVGAVNSVNGKTGDVELTAEDVGAASLTAFNEHLNDFSKLQFGNRPYVSTEDKTYYIDAVNGNDENDGESPETAFKTWAKVESMIPRILHHRLEIRIIGHLPEVISVKGVIIVGGREYIERLVIIGDTEIASNHEINGVNFVAVTGTDGGAYMGCGISYVRSTGVIQVNGCTGVTIGECEPRNFGGMGISVGNSFVRINECDFGVDVVKDAIVARAVSRVFARNNVGNATDYGLMVAEGSTIFKFGTQPTGSKANEHIYQGGEIK